MLLVTKPFAVGDYVDTPCGAGTVKDLTLTYTYLDTPDGLRIAAPNSSISAGKITNYTALGTRRIEHAVSASYDAPVQTVRQALLDAVARTPGLLDKPAPEVYVNAYGESGIEYIVRPGPEPPTIGRHITPCWRGSRRPLTSGPWRCRITT